MRRSFVAAVCLVLSTSSAWAGPYSSTGILASDPAFTGWATGVSNLTRGPQDISNPSGGLASYGTGSNALGHADGTLGVVSLGDGGHITLTFARPIVNGAGADFAVFENGFRFDGTVFGELAMVEVSSNGKDFVRFQPVSLTPTVSQLGTFGGLDASNIYNIAGQFPALEGTPFDLQELAGMPALNVNGVTHVRIVDVVGSIDPAYARYDSLGNAINDPWPTAFAGSGFDLDAVGVIHQTPEPATLALLGAGLASIGLARLRKRRGLRVA